MLCSTLRYASATGASEENLSDFFAILENAMKSASKEMFLTFLLKQPMTGNGAFRTKSSWNSFAEDVYKEFETGKHQSGKPPKTR